MTILHHDHIIEPIQMTPLPSNFKHNWYFIHA